MILQCKGPTSVCRFLQTSLDVRVLIFCTSRFDSTDTGDRWITDGIGNSKYIWQPLVFQNGVVQLAWHDVWEIDVNTGETS